MTTTNLAYAAPHHHGWEASAYSGLAAVNIFVVNTIVLCHHHKLKLEVELPKIASIISDGISYEGLNWQLFS